MFEKIMVYEATEQLYKSAESLQDSIATIEYAMVELDRADNAAFSRLNARVGVLYGALDALEQTIRFFADN